MPDDLRISRLEQIDRDWVAAVLAADGQHAAADALAEIGCDILGGGTGFMSRIVHVRLDYGGTRGDGPSTLVVKLPPTGDERFAIGAAFHLFMREIHFYRDLAPRTPVAVPRRLFADGDPRIGAAVLVLEDASAWQPVDQTRGLAAEQAGPLVDMMAAMHARWWQAPELLRLDWLPDSLWGRDDTFTRAWPDFVAQHGSLLEHDVLRLGERLAASQARLHEVTDASPWTLTHGDLRAGNVMVAGPDPTRRVLILDWQIVCRAPGALDAARLVCGSVRDDLARQDYRAFADRWHAGLVRGGVDGYDRDEAWRDFRLGILAALHVPVCFHANIAGDGESGRRVFKVMAQRMFGAATHCAALEALVGG